MTLPTALAKSHNVVPALATLALPRAAVVVGSFNQGSFVEAAIRSVAAQTYRDFECVVVDDCSSDDSGQRIETLIAELADTRFRVIHTDSNGGQMATMGAGLRETTAPFVAFLDADDLWHPTFLEQHLRAHLSDKGIAAVSVSNLAIIDADGIQLSGGKPNFSFANPRQNRGWYEYREDVTEDAARYFIHRGIPVGWIWSATSGLMFRRAVLELLYPADTERLRICSDGYLAKGAHILGGTVRIDHALGCYRLHGNNGFSRNRLLGDQTELGRTPRSIIDAINDELTARLVEHADALRVSLPPSYLATVFLHTAGYDKARELARSDARARTILSSAPRGRWLKAMLKNIERRIRKVRRR